METLLAATDLGKAPHVVLTLYMLMLLGLGYAGYRRSKKSEEDYYLAGRNQGLLVTVLTIMATMFSSAAILGIPGLIYKEGAAFFLFALNLPVSGAAVYIIGNRIRKLGKKHGYLTPGDLLADHYGNSDSVRILAAVTGFLYVIPYIVMQIKAGGHLAVRLFPDAEPLVLGSMEIDIFALGATVLSLITMIYVLVGGMRSVAWTDVVQGSLLLAGMLLAGVATINALGGISGYFEKVTQLPVDAQSLPGSTGGWPAWKLVTVCSFAALATMIQPGQWIRYYSARSSATLRRSSVIFAVLLPCCFLFGIMLVAYGGRALYPTEMVDGVLQPHPNVGRFDQIAIVMIQEHLPKLLGSIAPVIVSVFFVAIMAASMSTADSNLHALSAVLTRDIYDKLINPRATEKQRAWVGRGVIIAATLLALLLVHTGEKAEGFHPLKLIAEMMLVAIGFSCQLLPATIDVLFLKKGTRQGMIAGTVCGLIFVSGFVFFSKGGDSGMAGFFGGLKKTLDIGFCGFVVNATVFAIVSSITRKPKLYAKS